MVEAELGKDVATNPWSCAGLVHVRSAGRGTNRCLVSPHVQPEQLPQAQCCVLSLRYCALRRLLLTKSKFAHRWYPGQITDLTNGTIEQDLRRRLDLLQAANITVVAPAGPGLGLFCRFTA